MAMEHGVKKHKISEGGDGVPKDGVLTPLYEVGQQGGNPESPAPEEVEFKKVPDPMGFLKHLGDGGREK